MKLINKNTVKKISIFLWNNIKKYIVILSMKGDIVFTNFSCNIFQ